MAGHCDSGFAERKVSPDCNRCAPYKPNINMDCDDREFGNTEVSRVSRGGFLLTSLDQKQRTDSQSLVLPCAPSAMFPRVN